MDPAIYDAGGLPDDIVERFPGIDLLPLAVHEPPASPAKSPAAVEAEGLGKSYRCYSRPVERVLEGLTLGRWKRHRDLWALRDVDLRVPRGMVLGICGSNGAGKSTLLKILSGTTAPSTGRYRLRGRVESLLELGTGFDMSLSGRENLLYNGILHGFRRSEVRAKIDEIVEFSGLGEFIDMPLRTYSAGMGMRLGFSVAAAVDPDVLILDEVFAAGDLRFQKKCIDRIYEFRSQGKTILFCSHAIYSLRQLCDEAIWLHDGRIITRGDVLDTTAAYESFMRGSSDLVRDGASPCVGAEEPEAGSLPVIRDARVFRMGSDEEVHEITTEDSIEVRIWWSKPPDHAEGVHLGVGLYRDDQITCVGVGTKTDHAPLTGEHGCMALELPRIQLLSGRFLVVVWLLDEGGLHRYQEYVVRQELVVTASTEQVGVFRPEHAWSVRDELPLP